jgi:hypothetical protein
VTVIEFMVEEQDEDHGGYQMDNYECKTHLLLHFLMGVRTLSWTFLHMHKSAAGAMH